MLPFHVWDSVLVLNVRSEITDSKNMIFFEMTVHTSTSLPKRVLPIRILSVMYENTNSRNCPSPGYETFYLFNVIRMFSNVTLLFQFALLWLLVTSSIFPRLRVLFPLLRMSVHILKHLSFGDNIFLLRELLLLMTITRASTN